MAGGYHRPMKPITLTFDNGPTPGVTDAVLDILADHYVLASFFVIGEKLRARSEAATAVERACAAGHWIGNHTDTHDTPLGQIEPPDAARAEIIRAQFSLGAVVHPDKLFRPFGGGGKLGPHLLNEPARDVLTKAGYTCVLWNSIPRDWPGKGNDPEGWLERAQAQCRNLDWPLVVLHDIPGACVERLDEFLTWLKSEGYDIRQDFPDNCIPIRRGEVNSDVMRFLMA